MYVMKKMVKEIGLTLLIALAAGDAGPEIVKETIKLLTSTAFDRAQESEADATAVELLSNANIDPKYLADFLFRISVSGTEIPKHLNWISTHPDSKERAGIILSLRKNKSFTPQMIMSTEKWEKIQLNISSDIH